MHDQLQLQSLRPSTRATLNAYFKVAGQRAGDAMSDGQIDIVSAIIYKLKPRGVTLAPTGYGKSEAVAMAVIICACLLQEDFIVASVKYGTADIIMKKVIEHIFDSKLLVKELEIDNRERLSTLKRERNKTNINFKKGGYIKIVSLHGKDDSVGTAIGEHVPNVVLDESPLLSAAKYLMVLKMLEGTGDVRKTFLFELGNAVNRNHFMFNIKHNANYLKIDISLEQAIREGRLDTESVEEKRSLPFFEQFYECKFPDEDEIDEKGYRQLLTEADVYAIVVAMIEQTHEDKKLGVDVAGGGDYNVYGIRQPHAAWIETKNRSNDTMTNVTEVVRIIDESAVKISETQTKKLLRPSEVYLDDIGIGRGATDRLLELGHNVNGVAVGESAKEPNRYANKKAEYYWRLRLWVMAKNDKGELLNRIQEYRLNGISVWLQLTWIRYKANTDKVLQIEHKDDLKKRSGKSPDFAEALMLTFADPVGQPNIRLL